MKISPFWVVLEYKKKMIMELLYKCDTGHIKWSTHRTRNESVNQKVMVRPTNDVMIEIISIELFVPYILFILSACDTKKSTQITLNPKLHTRGRHRDLTGRLQIFLELYDILGPGVSVQKQPERGRVLEVPTRTPDRNGPSRSKTIWIIISCNLKNVRKRFDFDLCSVPK